MKTALPPSKTEAAMAFKDYFSSTKIKEIQALFANRLRGASAQRAKPNISYPKLHEAKASVESATDFEREMSPQQHAEASLIGLVRKKTAHEVTEKDMRDFLRNASSQQNRIEEERAAGKRPMPLHEPSPIPPEIVGARAEVVGKQTELAALEQSGRQQIMKARDDVARAQVALAREKLEVSLDRGTAILPMPRLDKPRHSNEVSSDRRAAISRATVNNEPYYGDVANKPTINRVPSTTSLRGSIDTAYAVEQALDTSRFSASTIASVNGADSEPRSSRSAVSTASFASAHDSPVIAGNKRQDSRVSDSSFGSSSASSGAARLPDGSASSLSKHDRVPSERSRDNWRERDPRGR